MNYLAHLSLAYPNEGLIVGNFIGDHVRNKDLHKYSNDIQFGIRMHRSIDLFTDHHENTKEVRNILFQKHRHLSRVLVDIFYDHFLAVHFSKYNTYSLGEFVEKIQPILEKEKVILPKSAQLYLRGMITQNWLQKYESVEGISEILNKMAFRSGLLELSNGAESLSLFYREIEANFSVFYPSLKDHCQSFKKTYLGLNT